MNNRQVLIERRKLGRFKAKAGIVVEFSRPRFFNLLNPRVVKSVQILDINTEGLAFEYEGRKMWTADFKELSISAGRDDEMIESVPFKIISDHKIADLPDSTYGRRCGVQFEKLASHHRAQIRQFIQNHTTYVPKVPPKPVPKPKSDPVDQAKDSDNGSAYFVELFRQ